MSVRDLLDRAHALLRERRLVGAEDAFTQVIESGGGDDDIAEGHRGRSQVRVLAGDLRAAVADAVALVELRPRDANGFAWLGGVMVMAHEDAAAIEAYRRAFELGCDDPAAWCASADARLRRGDFEGALEDLARAVTAHPGYLPARKARAVVNAGAGRLEAAIEDWQRAIAIDPAEALVLDDYIAEARRRIASVALLGPRLAVKVVCVGDGAIAWVRRVAQQGGGVVSARGRMEVATIAFGEVRGVPLVARFVGVADEPGELADDAHLIFDARDLAPERAPVTELIRRLVAEDKLTVERG